MERAAPVRSSHTSTAGLLAWPHPDGAGSLPARRPNQPTEEFRKVVFGGQVTEEADGHNKTKMRTTGSAPKSKEITGIGIFKAESAAAAVATASRDRQASQITFSQDGTIPPRKPTSVAGVARQRELSHTFESEGDSKMKWQVSSAKSKELSGHDIFADHEDPKPNRSRRSDYGSSAALSPVKNANVSSFSFGEADTDSTVKTAKKKGTSNKSTDLNGKAISERDSAPAEKQPLNRAKPKGMSGSSIFADGKAPTTGDHAGRRTRQPPGGDSSILLG
ncbi:uncharacterized protein [Miscanthus floridulus]|uniref:uncharacterized protein n=1 Tax=Miscanthus floridulus TaxID=154761 RepID=UPI00345A6397